MVKKLFFVLIILLFLIFPKAAFAQNEFATFYDVAYDVKSDGLTAVTEKITIKNLTDKFFASNFALIVPAKVDDLKSFDSSGDLEAKVEKADGKSAISLKLNQQVVGSGKEQTFILKFTSLDFAKKVGTIWHLFIPKIPQSPTIEDYKLSVAVPASFGTLGAITPKPISQGLIFDKLVLNYDKKNLEKNGILAVFGQSQLFNVKVRHNLENNLLFLTLKSITLPPTTSYQEVVIKSVEPKPQQVTIDDDGNYLAWYKIRGKSTLSVNVEATVKLYLKSRSKESLSQKQIDEYLKDNPYWNKDNPIIKNKLANILKEGRDESTKGKVSLIYQFVTDHLSYDLPRKGGQAERLGAATVLNNPQKAQSFEFSDLFIALSRAASIPAREVAGIATTNFLHSWPEYYDPNLGWMAVDPGLSNLLGGADFFNQFDLTHIALSIRGKSSLLPMPADADQVNIESFEGEFVPEATLKLNIEASDILRSPFPAKAKVKIENNGNSKSHPGTLTVNSKAITILGSDTIKVGPIPPLGHSEYEFSLRTPNSQYEFDGQLEAEFLGEKAVKKVTVKPIFIFTNFHYLFLGAVALIFMIYFAILFTHIYHKRVSKKKRR